MDFHGFSVKMFHGFSGCFQAKPSPTSQKLPPRDASDLIFHVRAFLTGEVWALSAYPLNVIQNWL